MNKLNKILSFLITILFINFCFIFNANAEEIKIIGQIQISNPDNLNQGFIATFTNMLDESEIYEFLYEPSENIVEKQFFLAGNKVYKVSISFTEKWSENEFIVVTKNDENIEIVVVDGAVFKFDWVLKRKNIEPNKDLNTTAVETTPKLIEEESQQTTAQTSEELKNTSPLGIVEIIKKHSWSLILIAVVCLFPRIYKLSKIIVKKKGL